MITTEVRRLDDLGRIVIPKNIRKQLRMYDGDAIDIVCDGENITLSKHHNLNELNNKRELDVVAKSICMNLELPVVICNVDRIISVCGIKDVFLGCRVTRAAVCSRNTFDYMEETSLLHPIEEDKSLSARFIQPIIYKGEIQGAIIVLLPHNFNAECELIDGQSAKHVLKTCADYLSILMEDVSE